MEPPAKKAKLKLSVRPPSRESTMRSQSPDTIAVARPRRDSSLKTRYSEDMVIDNASTNTQAARRKPSPAASSDLSSLSSVPLPEKHRVPVKEPEPGPSKSRDYSRDFMSYYVTGGDDDDHEEEAAPPPPKPVPPRRQEPPQTAPVPQPLPSIPLETKFKHHTVPPPYPPAKSQPPPRLAPPPLPQVNLIDTIKPASRPTEPDTVAVMIKKLEHLSKTLTEFGGVPPVPKSPGAGSKRSKYRSWTYPSMERKTNADTETDPQPKPQPSPAAEKQDGAVDNFLAMFDDDDSDKDEPEAMDCNDDNELDYKLPTTSEHDGPLKYGIVFIQNALRSWAYQRVSSQVAQQYQHMQMHARAEPQKRGPGRPRKFDNGDEQSSFPQIPPTIQFDLATTPEGAAIIAFQEVLDSGCLRLNCSLAIELSRALRHLYMQIDHLINQGSRSEPQWRCMSYGAQITAHKIRVEKWKDQQARAQQEMARQQQLANIQVMQQMGLPPNVPRVPMTAEQAQQAHAIELERRRGLQLAAQQPHLTKYITNPMSLDTNTTTSAPSVNNTAKASSAAAPAASATGKASTAAQASVNGTLNKPPETGAGNSTSDLSSIKSSLPAQANQSQNAVTAPSPTSPATLASVQLDKIKLYMPNYLPRSGQSMKFSFAPNSELAIKAFGAQAFPNAGNATSSIPNRGPMNISSTNSPTMPSTLARQSNGATPALSSNAPAPSPPSLSQDNSDTIQVAIKPPVRRESEAQSKDGKSAATTKDGKRLPSQSSMMSSFNAINNPGAEGRSNTVSEVALKTASPSKSSESGHPNGKMSNLASRFPHPGAVVVDK